MLSKAQRVEVAKDVLKVLRMRSKGYVITPGEYLDISGNGDNISLAGKEIQQLLNTGAIKLNNCEVCARGACVISKARLWNNVVITNFSRETAMYESVKMFGKKLCGMIELAFEGEDVSEETEKLAASVAEKCISFATSTERVINPRKVLKRIMQNIVDNGGDFKP